MEEDLKDLHRLGRAFTLGLSLAEHVHGIRRGPGPSEDKSEAILATLRGIASGDLDLIGSPEEVAAAAPPEMPESAKERLPETLDEPRRLQREMAALILRSILGTDDPGGGSHADSPADV